MRAVSSVGDCTGLFSLFTDLATLIECRSTSPMSGGFQGGRLFGLKPDG
jgi:hypothetical protein